MKIYTLYKFRVETNHYILLTELLIWIEERYRKVWPGPQSQSTRSKRCEKIGRGGLFHVVIKYRGS
jgi:hypothetical protein